MNGKVALVMGGGAGTGRATAMAFAAAGAKVVVADLNPAGGNKTLNQLRDSGGEGIFVEADMSSRDDIERVIATTRAEFGALHAVSNNGARGTGNLPFTEMTESDWDDCMATTLKGVWMCMQAQLPLIEASGGGAIVNVASASGMGGEPLQSVYAAAKAGVINLTKSAATEYAKRGVRVNTVCPAGIRSGGMEFYLDKMPEMRDKVLGVHAMGRLAEPEEVADAVVYLCSDKASFITGHDLLVDGGARIRSNVLEEL